MLFRSLPRGTVASRLRRARAQFRQHVGSIELGGALPGEAISPVAEPMRLRRERRGTLQHALLAAGASSHSAGSTSGKTLAALGLAGLGGPP